jgi:hypothetical protein
VVVEACRSIPRSSCRCLVPKWAGWEAVGEVEEDSTLSRVECQEVDSEELHKGFLAASNFDMMRRSMNPGSSPSMMRTPIPAG